MANKNNGWFSKITSGLKKSSDKITDGIQAIISKKKLDDDTLDELQDLLITTDIGITTANEVIQELAKNKFDKNVSINEVKHTLAQVITTKLHNAEGNTDLIPSKQPHVIVMVGVNGSGKTTTIGKMAYNWSSQGKKVRIVAGDTFRAAAKEQLDIWAQKASVPIVYGNNEQDTAGLVFDAMQLSQKENDDILIIDTAGRLQNNTNLMNELSKLERVIKKIDPTAPHSCLLTIDATTGQNAHSQVELFQQAIAINGLVITKLDGTAKGGVLVSIYQKHKLPIYSVGIGEKIEDLKLFNSQDYIKQLLDL